MSDTNNETTEHELPPSGHIQQMGILDLREWAFWD